MVFIDFRESARGGNRTGYRPVPASAQAALPTTVLIPPWNLASPEIADAPEIQALGEQCVSIVLRPEKHYF